MITRGENPPCKKHVFAFPSKSELRAKWVAAIRREDTCWNPDNSGICELHFCQCDFLVSLAPRNKTERQRLRLKPNAIPSVFVNYPDTVRPKLPEERQTNRATASARRSYEEEALESQIEAFMKEDQIEDLDDLFSKLSMEILPSGHRTWLVLSTTRTVLHCAWSVKKVSNH